MKHRIVLFLLAGSALVLLAACGADSFRASVLDPPAVVPDFTLTDQYGRPFRLSEQRGNVVVLFFGYTSCPDVCPTTLATWRQVYDGLGTDVSRVRFVFVTVDPERDAPERLAVHLGAFNPAFIGLTGTPEELDAVYQTFGVYHEKDTSSGSALGYLVSHTASTFVLDRNGQWRLLISYGTEAPDIVHDVRLLLK